MGNCQHENFFAQVDVTRMPRKEGGPIENYCAEVKIKCTECGEQFEFIGMEAGVSFETPTTSVDFTEARLPIRPFTNRMATKATFQMTPPPHKNEKPN